MADLPLSALTADEKTLVSVLERRARKDDVKLLRLERYRDAEERVRHIGIAVPPELRDFETSINVPGMAVAELVNRQALRGFVRSTGRNRSEEVDDALQEAMEFNNIASQSILLHQDARTFGRAFATVSTNEDDPEHPLITVEPTRGMAYTVDRRRRILSSALRTYTDDDRDRTRRATLYLPEATLWLARSGRGWVVEDRDDHGLGRLAMVMFLNQQRSGEFGGRSSMADVLGKVDAIARTLTNLQIAAEKSAIPDYVIFGLDKRGMEDENGDPIPVWEAYWTKIKAMSNEKGSLATIPAAQLDNITKMVDRFLVWCAIELGLPTRYAGMDTSNPAAEGAIIADEFRLIKRVENINLTDGDAWAWVMALYEEFRTGRAPDRNSIRALWHNPGTPTYSQRADAVLKLRSQGLLSVRGSWDELGWSEERKRRELEYIRTEQAGDPLVASAKALMTPGMSVDAGDAA